MIELYGKKYAKNEREFTSTLFEPGGTANGFYRKARNGIFLSDMQGQERAFIRKDGLGPVSVTRNHNGRPVYMFCTSTTDKDWLGVPDSYTAQVDGAESLAGEMFGWMEPAQ